jgi:hypothetical protein
MKNIPILIAIICFSTAAYSQFNIGPKVGISTTKIKVDEVDNVKSGDSKVGFHIGAFARFGEKIYFQPELTFTSSGGEIDISEDGGQTYDQITELKYNKLDLPLLVGLKFGDFFRINAGPMLSLILSQDARDVDNTVDEVQNNYNNAVIGYQAGIGVDVGNLTLDLRYEGNLSSLGESIEIGGQSFDTDMKNNQILLSLGFKLL